MMIADLVKENTGAYHKALEGILVRQIKAISSQEDYISILKLFYSYFGGVEQQIKLFISGDTLNIDQRRKAGDIAQDLRDLGAEVPALIAGADLPEISNYYEALGALYVIEGSTLGGVYISQMIAKQLNLSTATGLSFFNGYGDQTMAMWTAFKDFLNLQPKNETENQQVLEAANDTFIKFKSWIEKVNLQHG